MAVGGRVGQIKSQMVAKKAQKPELSARLSAVKVKFDKTLEKLSVAQRA